MTAYEIGEGCVTIHVTNTPENGAVTGTVGSRIIEYGWRPFGYANQPNPLRYLAKFAMVYAKQSVQKITGSFNKRA